MCVLLWVGVHVFFPRKSGGGGEAVPREVISEREEVERETAGAGPGTSSDARAGETGIMPTGEPAAKAMRGAKGLCICGALWYNMMEKSLRVRVTEKELIALRDIAELQGRTVSNFVRVVLGKELAKKK